jgi:hypothetical protein
VSQSPRWLATARMLRRAGFGATGPQIDAVVNQDWSAYLDEALDLDPDTDPGALATPRPMPVSPAVPADGAGDAALQEFTRRLFDQMTDLTSWWVRRMAAVHEPVHEKLTLLWHNHFATSAQKVAAAEWMGKQNQKLRTLKLCDFHTLAYAMLTDSAMLFWLDGVRNSAGAANENLSREFMESSRSDTETATRKTMYAKGPARSPVGSSAQRARPRSAPSTTTAPTRPSWASKATSTSPISVASCSANRTRPASSPRSCGECWRPTPIRRHRRCNAWCPPTVLDGTSNR